MKILIKLVIAKAMDGNFVIGEFDFTSKILNNVFQLTTIFVSNTFHYSIKPLILPFCLSKPVIMDGSQIIYWVDVDLTVYGNLVTEYLRIKEELVAPKEIPEIKLH